MAPIRFEKDQYGSVTAHAPVGTSLHMVTRVPQIRTFGFLQKDDQDDTNEDEE